MFTKDTISPSNVVAKGAPDALRSPRRIQGIRQAHLEWHIEDYNFGTNQAVFFRFAEDGIVPIQNDDVVVSSWSPRILEATLDQLAATGKVHVRDLCASPLHFAHLAVFVSGYPEDANCLQLEKTDGAPLPVQ